MKNSSNEEIPHTLLFHWSMILLNSVSFLLNFFVISIMLFFRQRFFFKQCALRGRKRKVANHNRLLMSMASADLLVGCFGLSTGILLKTGQELVIYKLCGTIPLIGAMLISLISLVFITVDQLLAVKYPFKYNRYLTCSRVTKIILISWILPAIATVVHMVLYLGTDANTELRIRNAIFTFCFLIGFIFLITSNYGLLKEVKMHHRKVSRLSSKEQSTVRWKARANNLEANDETPVQISPVVQRIREKRHSICLPVQQTKDSLNPNSCCAALSSTNVNVEDSCRGVTSNNNRRRLSWSFKQKRSGLEGLLFNPNDSCSSSMSSSPALFRVAHQSNTLKKREVSENSSLPNGLYAINVNSKTTNSTVSAIIGSYLKLSFKAQNIRERKIRIMCIWIITVFLICWLPHIGYRFSFVLGRTVSIPWIRRLSQCLALFNSLLNPCIYFLMKSDFRQILQELVSSRKRGI